MKREDIIETTTPAASTKLRPAAEDVMYILKDAMLQEFDCFDVGFICLNRTAADLIREEFKKKVELILSNHHLTIGASSIYLIQNTISGWRPT